MPRQQRQTAPEELAKLREEMEQRRAKLDAIKIAYMHNAPFGLGVPSAEDVRATAQEFIAANYDYQKALYGKIRVKLSTANLLR